MIQSVLLSFPRDFGAHPAFRNEWWYVTGWLETPDKKSLGFQITFFRVTTEHDADAAADAARPRGFSRKGPRPEQASYYYSEPQLQVTGTVTRNGKGTAISGIAWLDHEWSTEYLDPNASGWDWVGANLDDGSALMAFQIRGKDGRAVWTYAGIRHADGRFTLFEPDQVKFEPSAHGARLIPMRPILFQCEFKAARPSGCSPRSWMIRS